MGTVFRILTLCYVLGFLGCVTSDSDCGSNPFESQITLLVDTDSLVAFLATTKQSEDSASTKYFYSKEPISCSKNEDCANQGCCEDKKAACNMNTKQCDCLDSSNKFTGRPLLYLKNAGKCGVNQAGCTICLELDKSGGRLILGQAQRLPGNRKALALSSNGNQTSLMETGDSERIGSGLIGLLIVANMLGVGVTQLIGTVSDVAGGLIAGAVITIEGVLGAVSSIL